MKVVFKKNLLKIFIYFIKCNSRKNLLNKAIIFSIIILIEMLIVFLLRNRFYPYLDPESNTQIMIENNGFINIVLITNSGIGFSALSDKTAIVYAIQSIVMVLIFIWFLFSKNIDFLITLTMIFSGALANIIDRATSGNNTVLDYFQFWFGGAIFNFADSTIVCGFIALFICYLVRFILQIIHDKKIKKDPVNEELQVPPLSETKEVSDNDLFA